MKGRLLYVSSSRETWYHKGVSAKEHFAAAPYSIDAIGYYMEKRGWTVAWLGCKWTCNPFVLAREIDEFMPDVVYTYGSTTSVWPVIVRKLLCRHKRFKVVHGWDDDYRKIGKEVLGWPGYLLMAGIQKFLVKTSDYVVTLSRHLQKCGRKWGVECHYIPNGADVVTPDMICGTIKLAGRFNFVYTGDKARWKKTEDVCREMRKLPNDIKLYFTGRDYKYLEQYRSENCIFLGFLPKAEQFSVMEQADAFVITSDQDCNAKLQEYMRWHKPIVAYDGQMNNVLTNGKSVLLVKSDGYAEAMRTLADNPCLCADLVRNAEDELPVYSWAQIAEQLESFFKGIWNG